MNVVDFLKDKERLLRNQLKNVEIKSKLEPQLRQISQRLSETLTNTLNTPWLSRASRALDQPTLPAPDNQPAPISAAAAAFVHKWQPLLGQQTHLGEWLHIDQARINQFAAVTEDNQWIHVDEARAAAESPFGTTIAHGFLTLALLPKLTENTGANLYPEARLLVNYGLNKVRFPYPVKVGSCVRARTLLKDMIPGKRSVDLISEIHIEIKDSKREACIAETVLRIYF